MKFKIFGILLIFAASVALLMAESVIKKFVLDPGYNKVTLKWETGDDSAVKGYEVQRGYSESELRKLSYMTTKTSIDVIKKYEYDDMSVFKSTTGSRTFYYRIKILNKNGTVSYSQIEKVVPTVSSARRTWGSIKAMFR